MKSGKFAGRALSHGMDLTYQNQTKAKKNNRTNFGEEKRLINQVKKWTVEPNVKNYSSSCMRNQ